MDPVCSGGLWTGGLFSGYPVSMFADKQNSLQPVPILPNKCLPKQSCAITCGPSPWHVCDHMIYAITENRTMFYCLQSLEIGCHLIIHSLKARN